MENRIEILRKFIEDLLFSTTENNRSRFRYLNHMYSVSQFCALIALKRSENVELATMAGLLHDFYTYKTLEYQNHAENGAVLAKEVLTKLGITTEDETSLICSAIHNHSSKSSTHCSLKIKILQDDNEKSAMGIVSDTFRKMPDVITGEGMFRVSAWGREAEKHASMGFQHLIDSISCEGNNGYALLMGVDIYRMSTMHYVEEYLPDEIKNKFIPSEEARQIYPESEWFIEAWKPTVKPWYIIQDRAYEKGYIKNTLIGSAKCMLVQVKNTIELYKQALKNEPFELYGLTK